MKKNIFLTLFIVVTSFCYSQEIHYSKINYHFATAGKDWSFAGTIGGEFSLKKNKIIFNSRISQIENQEKRYVEYIQAGIATIINKNTEAWDIEQVGTTIKIKKKIDSEDLENILENKEFNFGKIKRLDLKKSFLVLTIGFKKERKVHYFSDPNASIYDYLKYFKIETD